MLNMQATVMASSSLAHRSKSREISLVLNGVVSSMARKYTNLKTKQERRKNEMLVLIPTETTKQVFSTQEAVTLSKRALLDSIVLGSTTVCARSS